MPAPIILSTTFSLDDIGRYVCNTFDEAKASQDPAIHPDARPFDMPWRCTPCGEGETARRFAGAAASDVAISNAIASHALLRTNHLRHGFHHC